MFLYTVDIRSGIPGLPVAYLGELNNALALVPVPDQQTEEETVIHWDQLPNRDTVTTFKIAQVALIVFFLSIRVDVSCIMGVL